jgi:hypothetical protein
MLRFVSRWIAGQARNDTVGVVGAVDAVGANHVILGEVPESIVVMDPVTTLRFAQDDEWWHHSF